MWKLNVTIGFILIVCTFYGVYTLPSTNDCESFITSDVDVTFWSKDETREFLRNDHDGYVQLMTPADLHARGVQGKEDYLSVISSVASEFTEAEKFLLKQSINKVNTYLLSRPKFPKYISSRKLHDIPWVFALTKGSRYEDGMPHTRQHVIFITRRTLMSRNLANTLLHEKVHIYERMYPNDVAKWMHETGYKAWKPRLEEHLARSNPDLDPYIYIDPVSNRPMVATYKSDTPSNISDVTMTSAASEHPYEALAYQIGNNMV